MPRAPLLLLLLPLLPTPVPAAAALLPHHATPRRAAPPPPLVAPPEGRRLRRALRALLRLDDATLQSLAGDAPPPPPLQPDPQDRLDRLSDLLAAPAWPAGQPGPPQHLPGPATLPAATPAPSRRRRRAPGGRRYHARRYLYYLSAGECPEAPDGRPRMYCPTRGDEGQWVCVDEEELCDGVDHCPGGEDEDPTHCLFHTAMRGHMDILTKYVMLSKLT